MRALVLSGGGVKGAFQVGVLSRWLREGRQYDVLCGVSVGAINAGYLAQFKHGEEIRAIEGLEKLWSGINDAKVKKSWFLGKLAALWKPSLNDSSPLHQMVAANFDPAKVAASGKKLRVVAVSLDTGSSKCANESDLELTNWILASAAFPVMLTPVSIGGQLYVDGGVRNVTPLGAAIEAGADEIDVIMCDNPEIIPPFNSKNQVALNVATRTIELLVNQIQIDDLKVCGFKNELATRSNRYKQIKVRLVQPAELLTDDSLNFDPQLISKLYLMGQKTLTETMML